MSRRPTILSGVPVLVLADLPGRGDATDIVGAALEAGARWIALGSDRLPEGFLDLSTGVAGEITQKCVNYGVGLAVLGDTSAAAERSAPLRDWMRESNRGRHVWFLADEAELAVQLVSKAKG